jgi:hypothetical protein
LGLAITNPPSSSFNADFGQITGKTGNRTFQAKLRLTF